MKTDTFDTNIIQGAQRSSRTRIVMQDTAILVFVFEADHYFQGFAESDNLASQSDQ